MRKIKIKPLTGHRYLVKEEKALSLPGNPIYKVLIIREVSPCGGYAGVWGEDRPASTSVYSKGPKPLTWVKLDTIRVIEDLGPQVETENGGKAPNHDHDWRQQLVTNPIQLLRDLKGIKNILDNVVPLTDPNEELDPSVMIDRILNRVSTAKSELGKVIGVFVSSTGCDVITPNHETFGR